jgi:hypothetical protein
MQTKKQGAEAPLFLLPERHGLDVIFNSLFSLDPSLNHLVMKLVGDFAGRLRQRSENGNEVE